MNLVPLGDKLIVKQYDSKEKRVGSMGIIIPEGVQERPNEGVIVAVGPGRLNEAGQMISMTVEVGDEVVFTKYGGTAFKDEVTDEEFIIISLDDVMAKRDKQAVEVEVGDTVG